MFGYLARTPCLQLKAMPCTLGLVSRPQHIHTSRRAECLALSARGVEDGKWGNQKTCVRNGVDGGKQSTSGMHQLHQLHQLQTPWGLPVGETDGVGRLIHYYNMGTM
jgi:hypothetical protein